MKKITKELIIGIVIILISSPIISSTNISITETQKINTQTTPNITNPKIVEIIEKINETMIKKYMDELLEIGPRMTGTYGCEKASEYIYNNFENTGLPTRYHEWARFGNKWHFRYFTGKNVEVTIPGTDPDNDEIIIFNAHYDTVKNTVGANDDGSGTVGVLAAAYALSQYTFNRTIKLVTFSGEEIGLRGSEEYAKELYNNNANILFEFNADMIGHATTAEGGKTIGLSVTEDAQWILSIFEKLSNEIGLNFDVESRWSINRQRMGGSDYAAFAKYGYEVVACWQSDRDPYMHDPQDDINNVNISYLVNMTKQITGVIAYLADFENPYPQIKIASPKREKLYFEDRILKDLNIAKTIVIDDVLICTEVKPGNSPIDRVEFYYNNRLQETITEKPYQFRLNKLSIRNHDVKAVVYDEEGKNASDTIRISFINLLKNH